FGRRTGVGVGGRLFDAVTSVEPWQLTDTEVGLSSFFLHRDFRDYYNRHGGGGFLPPYLGRSFHRPASLSQRRPGGRSALGPFTLFRNAATWRDNPTLDEGMFHIANGTLRFDTRDSRDDPWSGWYMVADYERGTGRTTLFGPTSPGVRDGMTANSLTTYDRG